MFEAKRFLRERFQTVGGVVAHCRAAGVEPPNEEQVQKWFQRNSIPSDWLAKLLSLLEVESGGPVSLAPYMEGEAE